jgi:hypothetical protein
LTKSVRPGLLSPDNSGLEANFFLKFYECRTIFTGRSKSKTILAGYQEATMLDFLLNANLSIPMIQIILLMLMSTVSLLFGKLKLALLINYLFTLHWAYISNRENLMELGFENFQLISVMYFIFGLGIVLVASFAFMFQKNN